MSFINCDFEFRNGELKLEVSKMVNLKLENYAVKPELLNLVNLSFKNGESQLELSKTGELMSNETMELRSAIVQDLLRS